VQTSSAGICYVLKFGRYGSHVKRLKGPRSTIRISSQAARRLKKCLGPILGQLPLNCSVNTDRFRDFLKAATRSVRWTFEFRDPTWLGEEVFAIL
jgi:uncharacterized protein YecE (DUF72 family)